MWYACAVVLDSWLEDSQINLPIELSRGIRLERLPDWVKNDEALKQLSWTDRQRIRKADVAFVVEYDADALGSPDPDWQGTSPRGIQASIDERFALANLALWLAKPSRITAGPVLHFSRKGDSAAVRQSSSLRPMLISENEQKNILEVENIKQAGRFLEIILSLRRDATTWTAIWMLIQAVTERGWEVRYLLYWIVLEALFGPESPNETTYRLSQRIGLFLGDTQADKKHYFEEAKQAYAWRSRIVHGLRLSSLTSEKSLDLTADTERMVRQAVAKILLTPDLLLQFDSKERDKFLDNLAFR